MKPKFRIEDYEDKKIAMHCETEEEVKIFLRYLHSKGKTWNNGKSYLEETGWYFGEETCYYFNKNTVEYFSHCKKAGHEILEFEDFDWEEEE